MTTWTRILGVFDLETTGVDVDTARIVTAHVGVLDAAGAVVERRDWMLDPGVEIPEQATAVHGIATAHARLEGMPAAEGVAEIVAALAALFERGIPVVAYNASYDFTVLARECARHGVAPLGRPGPVVDPLVLDRALERYRKGKRTLGVACAEYGVALEGAHDAGSDAIAAGRLAQAIARRYPEELAVDAAELHELQVTWCARQAADLQDYMRRVRDPGFVANGEWPVRAVADASELAAL